MAILKNYQLIWESSDVPGIMEHLENATIYALDLETTGLDHNQHSIHGVALATQDNEWYITHAAANSLLDKLPTIEKKPVVMHNAPFDMHFLSKRGFRPGNVYDTMVAQYLLDENQELGLKPLAKYHLGIDEDLPGFSDLLNLGKALTGKPRKGDVNIYDLPLDTLGDYAARDARLTLDLYHYSMKRLQEDGMLEQFTDVEVPFTKILVYMEETGFFIDQVRLAELERDFSQLRDQHLTAWLTITDGVNPNSNDQVSAYLYDKLKHKPTITTATGLPSVDALSLMRLLAKDKNGAVQALLTYRKYEKLLKTYIYGFRDRLYNGYLYGRFNQTGTVTGRLSSSEPNLQNIPAHGVAGGQVRELFAAPPGYQFVNIDYSQLELRIAAHYTKDPMLLKVFLDNLDPHQMTADLVGCERFIAKGINFGWFYGAGSYTIANTIEESGKPRPNERDVREWINKFETAYAVARKWKEQVILYARELGYVRTIAGRKRRLPGLYSPDQGERAKAERQAINSIIQGSASDITKWAMIQIFPELENYQTKMNAQVHDELDFNSPDAVANEFAMFASQKMRQAGENFNMRVNLIAEPGFGKNWAEAKH